MTLYAVTGVGVGEARQRERRRSATPNYCPMSALTLSDRFARPRARKIANIAALSLVMPLTILHAQMSSPRALTGRGTGGVHAQVSEPKGDFNQNTGNGGGIGVSLQWGLDRQSIANWRLDAGFLTYGNETRRIPLAGTGGLVKLDLRTSNNIVSVVTGPQLQFGNGPVSPYVSALGGFSVFWTQSSVEGTQNDNSPFASTTNSDDASVAYGGAVGTYIRVYNGDRPVRIDLGARFLRHDDVKYLNDKLVREAFENNRDPIPLRGRADFMTYYLGVNVVLY